MNARYRIGQKVGRLTLIKSYMSSDGKGRRIWQCHCDCGNFATSRQDYLVRMEALGKSFGCGCVQLESANSGDSRRTHGLAETPTWRSWASMRQRCYNENNKSFKDYGGRGIKVCDKWLNNFEAFLEDMGLRPEGLSLDRKDVNGDYEPSNCRSTIKRRLNRQISSKGFK